MPTGLSWFRFRAAGPADEHAANDGPRDQTDSPRADTAAKTAPPEPPGSGASAADSCAMQTGNRRLRPLTIAVPRTIGRFTLGARIGSGTCGVVHAALDNALRREVAIKLSRAGRAQVQDGKLPQAQRAFETELVAAGKLTHPNIVTVHDAGQYGSLNYLVMELVEGHTLKAFGRNRPRLPAATALSIIVDCCHALEHAHQQSILHRDIKPANIMLTRAGIVKLLDFGIAVGLSDTGELDRRGPTLGTPNYMSPEQIRGLELGPESDLYSLGAVLFELLTGRQVFKATEVRDLFRAVIRQPAPYLTDFRPDLPPALAAELARVLVKDPAERFHSGVEMARALSRFVGPLTFLESRSAALIERMRRWRQSGPFAAFTEFELAELFARARLRQYPEGALLARIGTVEQRMMLLLSGMARADSEQRVQRVFAPGDVFGHGGLLEGRAECATITAVVPALVLELGRDAFEELPRERRDQCRQLLDTSSTVADVSRALLSTVDIPLEL